MRICLNNFLGVPWMSETHWSRLHVGLVTAKFSEWINTAIPFSVPQELAGKSLKYRGKIASENGENCERNRGS